MSLQRTEGNACSLVLRNKAIKPLLGAAQRRRKSRGAQNPRSIDKPTKLFARPCKASLMSWGWRPEQRPTLKSSGLGTKRESLFLSTKRTVAQDAFIGCLGQFLNYPKTQAIFCCGSPKKTPSS